MGAQYKYSHRVDRREGLFFRFRGDCIHPSVLERIKKIEKKKNL